MYIRWDSVNTYKVPLQEGGCADVENLVVEVHEDLNLPATRFLKVIKTEVCNNGTLKIFVDTSKQETVSR